MGPARRSSACAMAVLCAAVLVPATLAAPPTPIESQPPDGPSMVPNYQGHAATPKPVAAPRVPQNPFMALNGYSNVHDDAYQTDTYTWSGPLGRNPVVTSQAYGGLGLCGITIAFDQLARLITNCISGNSQQLRLLDPDTLETLASYDLPPRVIPPGVSPFVAGGGAYFFVDDRDRAVVSVVRHILVISLKGGANNPRFVRAHDFDVGSVVPADDQLNSALPDFSGRLWFVSRHHGVVGVLDQKSGKILGHKRLNEPIENSIAVDSSGGVYVVTSKAMYRFDATDAGRPSVTWRRKYHNIGKQKPGQLDVGSGTTPTVMGRKYVSITDNADPMNVVVYKRARRVHGSRLVCEEPVFKRGASATENSLIGTGRSLVVENNYGYAPPPDATSNGQTTSPGLTRVDIDRDGKGCHTVWKSREIAPSVVPKLSLANGLVYTYTKPAGSPDAWYVTALSFRTGKTIWSRLTGTGLYYNNHYAGLAISPRGVLYSGVLGGTIRLADG